MNAESLKRTLHGRTIGNEITECEVRSAAEAGFIVLFGAGDDLAEFRGAIDGEVGCWGGGPLRIDREGLLDEFETCVCTRRIAGASIVEAVWDRDGISWQYKTEIPHSTFDVLEDGAVYCRGIIFHIDDVTSDTVSRAVSAQASFAEFFRQVVRGPIQGTELRGSVRNLVKSGAYQISAPDDANEDERQAYISTCEFFGANPDTGFGNDAVDIFDANCLLSKWGFYDGDQLAWLQAVGDYDHRAVLVEVVKTRLVPALGHEVVLDVVETRHNPIRARSVDGIDTSQHWEDPDFSFNFAGLDAVSILKTEVLEIAKRLAHRA